MRKYGFLHAINEYRRTLRPPHLRRLICSKMTLKIITTHCSQFGRRTNKTIKHYFNLGDENNSDTSYADRRLKEGENSV